MNRDACDEARLRPFEQRWANDVLGWVTSAEGLFHWSARTDFPLVDASIFDQWHSDPQVSPQVLLIRNEVAAYGELWSDEDERSVELARLIVAPQLRRSGIGRLLIEELCSLVGRSHDVWVRVLPTNEPALRCYGCAGFTRVADERQAALNAGQRFQFVWMVRRNACDAAVG